MSDVLQEPGVAEPCRPGIIVLSSSLRILFIDRQATELLDTLKQNPAREPLATLPSSLLTLAQEIAATVSVHRGATLRTFGRTDRLIGSRPQRIRVRGIAVPQSAETGDRIVLVLSPAQEASDSYPTAVNGSILGPSGEISR